MGGMNYEEASVLAEKWNARLPKKIAGFAQYEVRIYTLNFKNPLPPRYIVVLNTNITTHSHWNTFLAYKGVFSRELFQPVGWA